MVLLLSEHQSVYIYNLDISDRNRDWLWRADWQSIAAAMFFILIKNLGNKVSSLVPRPWLYATVCALLVLAVLGSIYHQMNSVKCKKNRSIQSSFLPSWFWISLYVRVIGKWILLFVYLNTFLLHFFKYYFARCVQSWMRKWPRQSAVFLYLQQW